MKHISEFLNKSELSDPRDNFQYQEPFQPSHHEAKTEQVVDEIFIKLEAIFSGFKYTWPTDEKIENAKREWVLAFLDSDVKEIEKINIGLSKLRHLDSNFPPSPGQFIKLCEPSFEELGWPSIDAAYREAVALSHPQMVKNWTHAAIKETVTRIGSFNFSHMPEKVSRKKFEEVYKKLMNESIAGIEL